MIDLSGDTPLICMALLLFPRVSFLKHALFNRHGELQGVAGWRSRSVNILDTCPMVHLLFSLRGGEGVTSSVFCLDSPMGTASRKQDSLSLLLGRWDVQLQTFILPGGSGFTCYSAVPLQITD